MKQRSHAHQTSVEAAVRLGLANDAVARRRETRETACMYGHVPLSRDRQHVPAWRVDCKSVELVRESIDITWPTRAFSVATPT